MTESERLGRPEAAAREIAAGVVAPRAESEDRDARWPAEAMRALVAVSETLAGTSASTAMCSGMHCVGTAVIAARATDTQREVYPEPIARGEHATTLALGEPGTGSHFYIRKRRSKPARTRSPACWWTGALPGRRGPTCGAGWGCGGTAPDPRASTANEAMTLCGGIAYREDARPARILRDARDSHARAPTTDILKTWVGRSLLKLPLL
jgi:alkylation response protein AidB-like acyl-CoA dehydrogenase